MADALMSHRPNVLAFVVAYIGCLAVAALLAEAIYRMAALKLPSPAVGMAVFTTAASLAGRRFAKAEGWRWTRGDRRLLAAAYAGASLVLQILIAGLLMGFGWSDPATLGGPVFWWILGITLVLTTTANYVLARMIFGAMAKQEERRQAQ